MQDLSQAVVELSCFADDACASVHKTLQVSLTDFVCLTGFDGSVLVCQ